MGARSNRVFLLSVVLSLDAKSPAKTGKDPNKFGTPPQTSLYLYLHPYLTGTMSAALSQYASLCLYGHHCTSERKNTVSAPPVPTLAHNGPTRP